MPASTRELIMCRIAAINGAAYEWAQHAPLTRREGGIEEDGVGVIADVAIIAVKDADMEQEGRGERAGEAALSRKQWVVLAYTDQMTGQIEVDDEVFTRLHTLFTHREIVEDTIVLVDFSLLWMLAR